MPRFLSKISITWMWLFCLIAIYSIVRLLQLDRLVTTDEPFWLGASANFYRALRTGNLADTYQLEHPGVLTMWAGSLAFWLRFPEYSSLVPHNLDGLGGMYSIESVLRGVGRDPLPLMVAAKVSKVLLQALFFGFGLVFLKKSIGPEVAVVSGILIAFSPFLTGLDSALHVDGMAAITTFAGFCAIVYAAEKSDLWTLRRRSLLLWAIAGFFCATAWLTRFPAVLLLGVAGLGLLLQILDLRRANRAPTIWASLRMSLIYGLTWFASGIVTSVLIWPAMWVAPRETLVDMWNYSREAAGLGHENPLIFMGVVKSGDPGWLFYPVSILWRASMTDWIGLAALIVLATWAYKQGILTRPMIRVSVMALVYVLVFVIAQSFGAKKFDRYILPVFPLFTLTAGIGLCILGRWTADLTKRPRMYYAPILLGVAINIVFVGAVLPYRLDYFSPLMGGPQSATTNMQMGWGQGGDKVAEYLELVSSDESIVVQTTAVPSAFTYFLPDDSSVRFAGFPMNTPAGWYETDYYVAGIQQTQRNLSPAYRWFRDRDPEFSVHIGNVPYFEVYAVRNSSLPTELMNITACNYEFGGELTLMQIIDRDESVDFYFLSSETSANESVDIIVTFVAPDGSKVQRVATYTPADATTIGKLNIPLPASDREASLDQYSIEIEVSRDDVIFPVVFHGDSRDVQTATTHSECYYAAP